MALSNIVRVDPVTVAQVYEHVFSKPESLNSFRTELMTKHELIFTFGNNLFRANSHLTFNFFKEELIQNFGQEALDVFINCATRYSPVIDFTEDAQISIWFEGEEWRTIFM
jgi:hypothetical protein